MCLIFKREDIVFYRHKLMYQTPKNNVLYYIYFGTLSPSCETKQHVLVVTDRGALSAYPVLVCM